MTVVTFVVDYSVYKEDEPSKLVPEGICYVTCEGKDYSDAALGALQIVASRGVTPTDIREDI